MVSSTTRKVNRVEGAVRPGNTGAALRQGTDCHVSSVKEEARPGA